MFSPLSSLKSEIDPTTSLFSLKSPFSPDVHKIKQSLFKKEPSKQLCISQGDKLLIKLHGDVLLQDDFPETFNYFESNSNFLSLPEDFPAETLDILINFFYIREVAPITISKTFSLLALAIFLKVHSLIKEIRGFFLGNKNENEVLQIFKNSLGSFFLFQNSSNPQNLEVIQQIICHSMTFLLKNNKTEEIMKAFNHNYFTRLQKTQIIEKTFNFFVEIFKNSSSSNETLMEFLLLYKNSLIEYFESHDENFQKDKFYQKFIEKNLDLSNLNIKIIRNYLEKLEIEGSLETKDFMINSMSENIIVCRQEIQGLKDEVSILKLEIEKKQKINGVLLKKISKVKKIQAKKYRKERKNFEERMRLFEEKLKKEGESRQKLEESSKTVFNEVSKYTFASESVQKGNFLLANSDTTAEKTTKGDSGIRCNENPLMRFSDQKTFSIKINKTKKADIMFGFCVKTADNFAKSGYYTSKLSFMLYLLDGFFWCRNKPIEKYTLVNIKQAAISNQIFSASLDVKLKILKFYLNKKLLGEPIEIDLDQEEAGMMCPCVDLGDEGDKVSLVLQDESELN